MERFLARTGLLIIIVTSGLHDWKFIQVQMRPDYYFHDFLSMLGGDLGMLMWAWALKIRFFETKVDRYLMDYAMDLCIVDMVYISLFNPYVFDLQKLYWFAFASVVLVIKILLNRYWHWFRIQKII